MQSFGAFFNDNKALTISLILIAAIVGAAILIFLYRLVFGRRLHMAGGRPRQPRLGVIDSFDLDRQRQLVLIRRDNVEHLIMIGGPNDIVIESAFVRTQPSLTSPIGREKEGSANAPVVPMAMPISTAPSSPAAVPSVLIDAPGKDPAGSAAPPVVTDGDRAAVPPLELTNPIPSSGGPDPLAGLPAPGPVTLPPPPAAAAESPPSDPIPHPPATNEAAQAPPASPAPATPPPAAPTPSRFATTFPPRQLGAAGGSPLTRTPLPPLRTPGVAGSIGPRPLSTGPRPPSSAPLSRGTSAASLRRDPPTPPASAPEEPTPAVPSSPSSGAATAPPPFDKAVEPAPVPMEPTPVNAEPPPVPAKPVPTLPTTLDTLESLEEEMAKLLGRPPSAPPKTLPDKTLPER